MKYWNSGKLNIDAVAESFGPALICFGPFFMVNGIYGEVAARAAAAYGAGVGSCYEAGVGAIMTSVGILIVFVRQRRVLQRVEMLERLARGDENRA